MFPLQFADGFLALLMGHETALSFCGEACQAYIYHMAMSSEDWQTINAKIREMEQTVEALKKLRTGTLFLPDSVLRVIDDAVVETTRRIAAIKNTMGD